MRQRRPDDTMRMSPFGFKAGVHLVLTAFALMFQGPARFQPPRYDRRSVILGRSRAVARDMRTAAKLMPEFLNGRS